MIHVFSVINSEPMHQLEEFDGKTMKKRSFRSFLEKCSHKLPVC